MKRKIWLFVLMVVIIIVSIIARLNAQNPGVTSTDLYIQPHVYQYSNQAEEVILLSVATTSSFTGLGYNEISLTTTVTDIGTEYRDQSKRIILLTQGDQLSITVANENIYRGTLRENTDSDFMIEAANETIEPLPEDFLFDRQWMYRNSESIERSTPLFTVTFSRDQTVRISIDCLEYTGTYVTAATELSVTDISATENGCVALQSEDYLEILKQTTNFEITQDATLRLLYPDGELILRQRLETL